ncbi:unnamed protein product [Adineta steineri]|uniref:Uncharacterized protein n=1 Tax=Adineta steineri TaxID=433720 RepID=A0A814JXH9_9BILA|nr:unnamed protein product [Adineta steineri]CAF1178288.1 unnamed protein product [Adineta steineri]
MCSQWMIIFMLLPFLQVALARIIGLDEHVAGEDLKEDQFGIASSYFYKLTNKYSGSNRTLETIITGDNPEDIKMSLFHNYDIGYWRFIRLSNNKYRIQNYVYGGSMSLDIVKYKMKYKLHMNETADVLGQYWHLTRLTDRSFRFTNDFSGPKMALDVQADTHKPIMSKIAANHLGQHWIFMKAGKYSSN